MRKLVLPANPERIKAAARLTLLATLCHVRQTEITDSLVELSIQLVLKINTVDQELNAKARLAFLLVGARPLANRRARGYV